MYNTEEELIQEHLKLEQKIKDLEAFTRTSEFTQLAVRDANRLSRQKIAMRSYLYLLSERLFDGDL